MSGKSAGANGIPEKIAEQIRDLISRGVLAPGIHLGQAQLAEKFKASRVPVREALKLLGAEGIVLHDANRGFFVADISSDEARQLYRMRHILEVELLSTVPWPDSETLEGLKDDVKELSDLLKSGDRTKWTARHRDFHKRIFHLSPDKILVNEILRLWVLTDRYRSLLPPPPPLGVAEDGSEDENQLVSALAEKDRKKLLDVFEEDRTKVEKMLLDILGNRYY